MSKVLLFASVLILMLTFSACSPEVEVLECENGFHEEDGTCVEDDLVCDIGFHEEDGTCVVDAIESNLLKDLDFTNMTALEVAKYMGNGTNLGNTMEAYGHLELGIDATIEEYETIWKQPITTPEMIQGMKDAGFDTLRIPVAWTNTMDYENGDFTIREDFLDRVEEIVNYAIDADMFVIINDHWDGGWWGMFGSLTPETREKGMELYISMWTQIGTRFKDYSHLLIFESANEELGSRLNESFVVEDSTYLNEDQKYEVTNQINQVFVDTIRGLGGNNSDRFLLIAGYDTDIGRTNDERYEMPTDTANSKLMISVHYYTPWSYCGSSGDATWGKEDHYIQQNNLLEMMTSFTDQGYAVVIGEWGVLTKSDGSLKDNTIEFMTNFLDNTDLYGYVPLLWDTNAFYKREELDILDEDLKELITSRSADAQSELSESEIQANAIAALEAGILAGIQYEIDNPIGLNGDEEAVAWIMYTSSDWSITYSVGDTYDPSLSTTGIEATDVYVTEAGSYTIALDFTGTEQGYANGLVFSAIGISNGELLFPGGIIQVTEVLVNGEVYSLSQPHFTTTDDEVCTRLNLYNAWVSEIPAEARTLNPNMLPFASATILDSTDPAFEELETIQVTFNFIYTETVEE